MQGADDERLILARRALEERRVVRLLYHAYRDAAEARDVEPTRPCTCEMPGYLAGYCRLRQGARIFRLDRIDQLEVLDERFAASARHRVHTPHERDMSAFPEACVRRHVLRCAAVGGGTAAMRSCARRVTATTVSGCTRSVM